MRNPGKEKKKEKGREGKGGVGKERGGVLLERSRQQNKVPNSETV